MPETPGRLLVLAAHPDDESLGVGGVISQLGASGWTVEIVCATDGEASHPASPTYGREELAQKRRAELERAVTLLAPDAALHHMGLPDGEVADHLDEIVHRVVALVGTDGARTVLLAPWRHDAHPDHEAMGRAAALVAHRTDAHLFEYPIWFWHWGSPASPPEGLASVRLTPKARLDKMRAIAAHHSQIRPLSAAVGDEVLLTPEFLSHFRQDRDYVIASAPGPDPVLDDLHGSDPDPWQVDSWYEQRKRALSLAALPRERYSRVLEVGCSIGALAHDLAARADSLLAIDSSASAVALAKERLEALPHVDVRVAAVPEQWPDDNFDLICISEIGYFLSPRQLSRTAERTLSCLRPGGHLLLCHWRPPPKGWPMAGPEVHERFARAVSDSGGREVASYNEDSFLLQVFEAPS